MMTVQQFYSDESKWAKGELYNDDYTKACLLGALCLCYVPSVAYAGVTATAQETMAYTSALSRLCNTLFELYRDQSISRFNDSRDTTFEMLQNVCKLAKI